jgi:hypothetical protein
MPKYKPVSKLLTTSSGDLQSLLEQAHFLQALTQVLREAIDPVLADHITITNIRDNTAIVAADTPAWLSKIRYMAPTILAILKQQSGLTNLRKIQFKTQPPTEPPASEQTDYEQRRATLSSASSKILESAASGIHDPKLASALWRLSQHKKHGPNQ